MSRARDRADGVLHNRTHEDTDGGRESLITFKGEQSGGEISTLAQIQASHDGTSDDEKSDLIFKTNDGSDGASPTERARFDSAGNLLVGTTQVNLHSTSNTADAGARMGGAGNVLAAGAGTVGYFNRLSTDGTIADFRKDGTTVGSIGTQSGTDFFVTSGSTANTGLRFQTNEIVPVTNAAANRDNAIDIGKSNIRFKDLYLSGGAYIGGTAAANYLDDYEEGTHEMLSGISTSQVINSSYTHMRYTKIGNMVFCSGYFNLSSATSSTTVWQISLPFTSTSTSNSAHGSVGGPSPMHEFLNLDSGYIDVNWYIAAGGALARLYQSNDNGGWSFLKENDFTTNTSLYFNFNFRTNS